MFVALLSSSLSLRNSLPLGSATSSRDSSLVLWPPLPCPALLSRRALGERHRYRTAAGVVIPSSSMNDRGKGNGGSERLAPEPSRTFSLWEGRDSYFLIWSHQGLSVSLISRPTNIYAAISKQISLNWKGSAQLAESYAILLFQG